MSDNTKTILGVVLGIICAVALFCLVVVIGCSVNGLTFGEQVCEWFGANADKVVDTTETIVETLPNTTPIA